MLVTPSPLCSLTYLQSFGKLPIILNTPISGPHNLMISSPSLKNIHVAIELVVLVPEYLNLQKLLLPTVISRFKRVLQR